MANSFSQADRLRDDVDWSVSHRTPPPVPGAYHNHSSSSGGGGGGSKNSRYEPRHLIAAAVTTDDAGAAPFDDRRPPGTGPDTSNYSYTSSSAAFSGGAAGNVDGIRQYYAPPSAHSRAPFPAYPAATTTADSGARPSASVDERPSTSTTTTATTAATTAATTTTTTEGRRRGSFSFLRRNSSHNTRVAANAAAPPPLPATRIAQAHANAAADPNNRHFRNTSETPSTQSRRRTSSDSKPQPNMLRKTSKMRAQQQQQAEQERLAREAAAAQVPRQPPHLPSLNPLPGIASFGGDEVRHDADGYAYHGSVAAAQPRAANFSRPSGMASAGYNNPASSSSSPPLPAPRYGTAASASSPAVRPPVGSGEYVPIAQEHNDSITNRGRYSYASSNTQFNPLNSPRRVRRRKDPTPFNILVIGAKNSGKTSFLSFLRHSIVSSSPKRSAEQAQDPQQQQQKSNDAKSSFTSHYLETEIDGERVGLTLWDSEGLEKNIVDLQLREMTAFVEAKFEDTFVQEQKVMRSPGIRDTHIHCVFLVLDPVRLDTTIAASAAFARGGSNPSSFDDHLDLQVIRALWGKTTVIPVISKADTLTTGHMAALKRAVWQSMKGARLDPLEALELEDDADEDDEDAEEDDDDDDELDGDNADNSNNNAGRAAQSSNDAPSADDYDDNSDVDPAELPSVPKPKKQAHNRHSSISLSINGNGGGGPNDDAPYIPMSILSPDPYDLPPFAASPPAGTRVGRRFPWGFADPLEPEHCDFVRLRDSVFSEWRSELRELSRTKWYENWRTSRLNTLPGARQRLPGGVTPVAAVPSQGRSASGQQASAGGPMGGAPRAAYPAQRVPSANAAPLPRGAPAQPALGERA